MLLFDDGYNFRASPPSEHQPKASEKLAFFNSNACLDLFYAPNDALLRMLLYMRSRALDGSNGRGNPETPLRENNPGATTPAPVVYPLILRHELT